jgi:hypothetical protein
VRGLQDEETEIPATPHKLVFGIKPRISHLRTFGCPVIIRKWTTSDNINGKQTERGLRGIFIGLNMHQKGYVIFCPGSWSIVISDNVIFDENFNAAIDQTRQRYQDGIALRPIASFIPDITTTLEQTGTIADTPASVEEGNDLIDLTTPSDAPHTTPNDSPEDDTPNLVPQDDDDFSKSEDDAESVASDDSDDEASFSDEDLAPFIQPAPIEPESDTPQVLCRSTRTHPNMLTLP